ncbi:MAG: ribose-phosphate diphosphokinase [Gammaproteobacteria bacterium]|nr:ribose-phosphate pyrophosphokinase [Gammaproteobacteria bacterium]
MKIFGLEATRGLGERIAAQLGTVLAPYEERQFEDSEFKIRPLESVRGERVLVCQSLSGDAQLSAADKLMRLLVFTGALKDAGAAEVIALAPYLAFSRKDRRTRPYDPVATRYIAAFLEAAGVDALVTVDVHNPAAFDNAFRRFKLDVEAWPLFVEHFAVRIPAGRRVAVLSPDAGGMKRAIRFAEAFAERIGAPVELALMEKRRSEGLVRGQAFGGDVADATVIVVDDLVSTGTTMQRAAKAAVARGAASVHVAATHGLFSPAAAEALMIDEIETIVVTDTVPDVEARCPALLSKLAVLETAPLLAAAVRPLIRRV